ncbi:MAG TPA: amidohydrolase family protein, partial [Anaerolineae bacterium]
PDQRGAFPLDVLREPNVGELGRWADAANGYLRVVTLAPNLKDSNECARFLRERKIIPSLGHTGTGYNQAHQALAPQGDFTLVTHLFNAMTGMHHRNPGVVGAVLASNVPAMLICDGEHVHPAVVKVITRAKTTERVILVTDAIAGAGIAEGKFSLFDQPVYVNHGRAQLADGTLAGSVLTLNRAVINARDFAGLAFGDALKMATENPARLLELEAKGMLSIGADADVVMMDEQTGDVKMTMVTGKQVFVKDS